MWKEKNLTGFWTLNLIAQKIWKWMKKLNNFFILLKAHHSYIETSFLTKWIHAPHLYQLHNYFVLIVGEVQLTNIKQHIIFTI